MAWHDDPSVYFWVYFWGTHGGAELDLCLMGGPQRVGIEIKYTSRPMVTKSMRVFIADLKLAHLYDVIPGRECYPLTETITAARLQTMRETLGS